MTCSGSVIDCHHLSHHSTRTRPVIFTMTRLVLERAFHTVSVAVGATLPRIWNSGAAVAVIRKPRGIATISSACQLEYWHSITYDAGEATRTRQSRFLLTALIRVHCILPAT